jgi:Lrp/AsnC family transcriptional regulator, regulator for asnA, asnC and gidA
MAAGHDIDELDLNILKILQQDSRRPFQEIARDLEVSGGTVHVRFNKLKEIGVILGTRIIVDPQKLGFEVCAFVGINLHNARDYTTMVQKLKDFEEIIEVHSTTGAYNFFIKVVAKNTRGLHTFLTERLQNMPEVQSTETFISLDLPVDRDIPIDKKRIIGLS